MFPQNKKNVIVNVSKNVFNIDNNKKCFLSTKSAEWFLKDHVALKTGVMADEESALPPQE